MDSVTTIRGGFDRRVFLKRLVQGGLAAAAWRAGSVRAMAPQASSAAASPLIVRSERPQDVETPVRLLDSWITPNERFYVRSHVYTPRVDGDAWRLRVDGRVARPQTLSLDDLKKVPAVSRVVTLECAGNGRAFFDPPVAGVQWTRGAVGTARWTGVRLRDVLAQAGADGSAAFVFLDGADVPIGRMPEFIRQLPIAKALDPDTLLAFEMNGVPLPIANGYPLRAIVPGWEGAYSVKWLTHVEVSDREHPGFFVQGAYRYPRVKVAPGEAVDPAEMGPVLGLAVKSMITAPEDGTVVAKGRVLVRGFAWAGEANVVKVDVSVDGGSTWAPATLGRDRARYAWREFSYAWEAGDAGSYLVMARATDDRGRTQPFVAQWNPSGYLWNAIDQVRVNVERPTPPRPSDRQRDDTTSPAPPPDVFNRRCLGCHGIDIVQQQRLDAGGWTREVDKMIRWGATVTDGERPDLIRYLTERFPRR